MEKRIIEIYSALYNGPKKKKYLAEHKNIDVTQRTIENTIIKYPEDIIYDKELGAYRFNSLLPKFIPHTIFFQLFQESVGNQIIRNDFQSLAKSIRLQNNINISMIPTSELSILAQKIIMVEIAINSSCVLKIDYIGNSKPLEIKYVRPHKIITTNFTYYLYGSYDDKNMKNIGEFRSLALNGISNITPEKYIKDEKFSIQGNGNAYGLFNKEHSIILKLEGAGANFFKREGQFSKANFDFISEEVDGNVIMKMYYNNVQEVVKLIQSWMPLISIHDNDKITNEIYNIIQENANKLITGFSK